MYTPSIQHDSLNEGALLGVCSGHILYHPLPLLPSSRCPWMDLISLVCSEHLRFLCWVIAVSHRQAWDGVLLESQRGPLALRQDLAFVCGSPQCHVIGVLGSRDFGIKYALKCLTCLKSFCCSLLLGASSLSVEMN